MDDAERSDLPGLSSFVLGLRKDLPAVTAGLSLPYVTRFTVAEQFLDAYDVHQVGGRTILEYWIPADDLPALNDNLIGLIEITAEYR